VPLRPWLGRADTFAALFHGSYSLILHLAYRRLGDYHLAQDAAQLTFIVAFRSLASLRNPAAIRSWLCRIAVSQCARVRRGEHGIEPSEPLEAPAEFPAPDDELAQRELAGLVVRLLDDLPRGHAEVLRRHYLHRESTASIAQALDVPRTTVKKRLFDGRRKLRRLLTIELGSGLSGRVTGGGPTL
jgi:RNA polymerase sigma factor (sigma-70 family)